MPASDTESGWAAVVINYEAGEALRECVRSLLDDTSAGHPPKVVVVDNGSSDDSAVAVARSFPAVTVLHPGANLGYARAANLGIAATDAPVVAVCNPDLEVTEGAAGALVRRLATACQIAIVDVSEPTDHVVWEVETIAALKARAVFVGQRGNVEKLAAASPKAGRASNKLRELLADADVLVYDDGDPASPRRFAKALGARLDRIGAGLG